MAKDTHSSPNSAITYTPFLKGKAGEIKALGQVRDRTGIVPLIEVPPRKISYEKDGIKVETLDKALEGYANRVAKAWGSLDFCFLDACCFNTDERLADGRHPLTALFDEAREVDLAAIPVTGLDRDGPQLEAAEDIHARRRCGIAVRVRRPEMQDPQRVAAEIPKFLRLLGIPTEEVDLLLDFGELLTSETAAIAAEARAVIAALPKLEQWRSLVLCSGAFPREISKFIKPRKSGERPRLDWTLWETLRSTSPPLPRVPSYGDYGVTGANWGAPFNPKTMKPACKIVYATDREWVIIRGRSFADHGGGQYRQLAGKLVADKRFQGEDHCNVETKIRACAAGGGSTGNLEQWVTAATCHHLEVVRRQLASLDEGVTEP